MPKSTQQAAKTANPSARHPLDVCLCGLCYYVHGPKLSYPHRFVWIGSYRLCRVTTPQNSVCGRAPDHAGACQPHTLTEAQGRLW